MGSLDEAELWLGNEDEAERADRLRRLLWLQDVYPRAPHGFLFDGGWLSKALLEEAKYCFVYGQFVASTVLGYALMERLLAAGFYASGRDDLERASSFDLLEEAEKAGEIASEEHDLFDRLRAVRNPLIHFRRPGAEGSLEGRWLIEGCPPWHIVEEDARRVLSSLCRLLAKRAL